MEEPKAEEEKKDEAHDCKSVSRKWVVTVWSLVVGTAIVAFSGFLAYVGKPAPDGFTGLATLTFSTGIAYIGGNVFQKQIYHKEREQ